MVFFVIWTDVCNSILPSRLNKFGGNSIYRKFILDIYMVILIYSLLFEDGVKITYTSMYRIANLNKKQLCSSCRQPWDLREYWTGDAIDRQSPLSKYKRKSSQVLTKHAVFVSYKIVKKRSTTSSLAKDGIIFLI